MEEKHDTGTSPRPVMRKLLKGTLLILLGAGIMVIYFGWIFAVPSARGPHIVCYSGIVPIPIHVGWIRENTLRVEDGAIGYFNDKGYGVSITGNCVAIEPRRRYKPRKGHD